MNYLGVTDGKERIFKEYFESIKTKFQNNEVYSLLFNFYDLS